MQNKFPLFANSDESETTYSQDFKRTSAAKIKGQVAAKGKAFES